MEGRLFCWLFFALGASNQQIAAGLSSYAFLIDLPFSWRIPVSQAKDYSSGSTRFLATGGDGKFDI